MRGTKMDKRFLIDGQGKRCLSESMPAVHAVYVKKQDGYGGEFRAGKIVATFESAEMARMFIATANARYAPTPAHIMRDTRGSEVQVDADDSFVLFDCCLVSPAMPLGGDARSYWGDQIDKLLPKVVANAWRRWQRRTSNLCADLDRE